MEKEHLAEVACECLHLDSPAPDLADWTKMVDDLKSPHRKSRSPLSESTQLHDAYISVVEALKHGGIPQHATVNIQWVDSEQVNKENVAQILKDADGILVPGGFGDRGIEGMIDAIRYARENNIPSSDSVLVCSLRSWNLSEMWLATMTRTVSS